LAIIAVLAVLALFRELGEGDGQEPLAGL
jgi:hypothetical protein